MKLNSLAAISLATLFATGCTVTTGPATNTLGTGRLEVSWTIAMSSDPAACTNFRVGTARVEVFDANGAKVNNGSDTQTCTAFATSFTQSFTEGNYTLRVAMIGTDGTSARSTTVAVPFTIDRNFTKRVPVDFPTASFFP